MKILTLGASWVAGSGSSDPKTKSWPAQLASKYNVEVVNLGRDGASNHRVCRIGVEELCMDPSYDFVILCLGPGMRSEILKNGKWHQIWPGRNRSDLDKIFSDFWMPWNDLQNVIYLSFYFIHSVKALGIPLFVQSLTFNPQSYASELSWIMNYANDNDFRKLGMPLSELNIGIKDLDRKLKCLKQIHLQNLKLQPLYLEEIEGLIRQPDIKKKYGKNLGDFGHPNDQGYEAFADYFAGKIGLS
jgi:hypothetical protein